MNLRRYLHRYVTRQAIAVALVAAGKLLFVHKLVAVPYFERVAGFRPFDIQFPLGSVAVAIQLGAYSDSAARAYAIFAGCEILLALAAAVFFMLLWCWMFSASSNSVFIFLESGGILLAPFAALLCDITESLGFAGLIIGLSGPFYEFAMEFSVFMHKLKFAFEDIRVYFTLFFAVVMAVQWMRRQGNSS